MGLWQGLSYFLGGCSENNHFGRGPDALELLFSEGPLDPRIEAFHGCCAPEGASHLSVRGSPVEDAADPAVGGHGGVHGGLPGCSPTLLDRADEALSCEGQAGVNSGDFLVTPGRREDQAMVLDKALRSFTESMQYGIEVEVVMDDGSLIDVKLSLDVDVTCLALRLKEVERNILLDDILEVVGPDESRGGAEAGISNSAHLNERCTTLLLTSTHFLTFSFDAERSRGYFEVCLRALLDSRREAVAAGSAPGNPSRDTTIEGASGGPTSPSWSGAIVMAEAGPAYFKDDSARDLPSSSL